jgi:DNA-binding winged helix-turn-helix (wHTH) protein
VDFTGNKFLLGEWQVDSLHNVLIKNGQSYKIEKRLMRVLIVLVNSPDKGVSKEQLLAEVWAGKIVSDETISVAISRLRKALGCSAKLPIYIETITGFGFRLLQPPKTLVSSEKLNEALATQPDLISTEKSTIFSIFQKRIPTYISIVTILLILIFSMGSYQNKPSISSKEELIDNDAYAKALFLMNGDFDELQQAEILLTKLNEQIPDNPHILNALGKAKYFQFWWIAETDNHAGKLVVRSAAKLFEKAVEIDPEFGDAYLQLGIISMTHERNLTLAEEYFVQSITYNPEQVTGHLEYAMLLLIKRRFDKAVHHNKIAQSIDPKHYSSASIEWVYNMAQEYELAQKELAKLFTIDPDSATYNQSAMRLYENMGDEKSAYIYYEKSFRNVGYSYDELREANNSFLQGGLKSLNYWLANVKKEQDDIGQYSPPVSTARYHVTAGEYEKAIDYLELAQDDLNVLCFWLDSDPKYASLRALPRFKKLIKRVEKSIK